MHLDNREKKDNLAKEKMERERLKYLKRNKIEKYINILREANDIFSWIGQTDAFINEIESKVFVQK